MNEMGISAVAAAALAIGTCVVSATATAQGGERTGKQVVETLCVACHGTGAKGAPRIGDKKAWATLASQGLTGLTQSAIQGVRQMPPHGGNPSLTDTEIKRAITYMVNQSGGHWAEPVSRTASTPDWTGEQIVQERCASCHRTGEGGAPRIGDLAAWIPRLKYGVDVLVRSGIKGHGAMPARGGQADLTDAELRNAVIYMINPGYATTVAKVKQGSAVPRGQDYRLVDGTAVYFGVIPAEVIRRDTKDYPQKSYGVAPLGPDQYYVTIALFDAASGKRISDATVRARVSTTRSAGPEKPLDIITIADAPTFGNYFAMGGTGPFEIDVHIRRPGAADTIDAKFEYQR
jgi:cytochrome c5